MHSPLSAIVMKCNDVRVRQPVLAQKPEWHFQTGLEGPHPIAQHHVCHQQMELVDQTAGEQAIKKDMAAEDQQVVPGAGLEFGNPRANRRGPPPPCRPTENSRPLSACRSQRPSALPQSVGKSRG